MMGPWPLLLLRLLCALIYSLVRISKAEGAITLSLWAPIFVRGDDDPCSFFLRERLKSYFWCACVLPCVLSYFVSSYMSNKKDRDKETVCLCGGGTTDRSLLRSHGTNRTNKRIRSTRCIEKTHTGEKKQSQKHSTFPALLSLVSVGEGSGKSRESNEGNED